MVKVVDILLDNKIDPNEEGNLIKPIVLFDETSLPTLLKEGLENNNLSPSDCTLSVNTVVANGPSVNKIAKLLIDNGAVPVSGMNHPSLFKYKKNYDRRTQLGSPSVEERTSYNFVMSFLK